MRRLIIALGLLIAPVPAMAAQTLHFEPDHTSVIFQYPHFGLSHPTGKIMGAQGALVLDTDDPSQSSLDITLDMATLTTALPQFDAMLKGEKYFDVTQYPDAHFVSTQITLTGDKTADVTGDLTLHGITQPVTLHMTFNAKAFNPALFKTGYGFSGTARISRKAFGLGNYEPIVGDDIDLIIDAEAY
ncbi:MAG: YceI family protein [Asticcacaulis sp.]|uniref:YceI family protein n=1 Tax=Asticcacaulis sp. TaxID=1872648 RepID=UPI003F7C946A